jgi:membrane fusion protein, multidrug efflux system
MKDPEPTPARTGQPQGGGQQPVPPKAPTHPEPQPQPASEIPKPPGRKRLMAIGVFVVLLTGALVLDFIPRWHQREVAMADTSQLAITTVSVVSPRPGDQETSLKLPAEVRPWREASVYARASGYLKDWVADIGTHVHAGQLLANIETPDLEEQLRQAQAQLILAQANLHLAKITDQRWQSLLKTASVSIQDAAEKSAARQVADASVQAAQANVQRLRTWSRSSGSRPPLRAW